MRSNLGCNMLDLNAAGVSLAFVAGLRRRVHLGVSLTGLMLAGTALAPAGAVDLAGGNATITVVDGNPNATPYNNTTAATTSTLTTNTAPGDFTFTGDLTDAGGTARLALSKIGAGVLTLSGAGINTYSGGTALTAGTVRVGKDSAFGVGNVALGADAPIQSGAAIITLGNAITSLGNGIVNVRAGEQLTLNGAIDGAGSISQNGPGTLVLNGNNSFRNLGINTGTVRIGSNTATGVGGVALNTNAVLQSGGAAVMINNVVTTTGNGIVNVRVGEVLTLNGIVDGAGSISQNGPGTLVLNGANNFTNLGINSGTVRVGSNIAAGIGGVALNTNATLQSGAAAVTLGNVVTTTGNGLVNVRAGEVLTLNGIVDGAGSISQNGPGTLVLNRNNSFNNLGINAGIVQVGSNTAAGIGGVSLNTNATLQSGGAAVALGNVVTTTGNGLIFVRAGEVLTLNGVVDGPGSISQTGPGTLVLNGANSFRNLGINTGTVQLGSNTAAGVGGVALNNDATLQSGGVAVTIGNVVTSTGNGLVNVRAGEVLTLNGILDGAGSVSQIGAGILVLNGANNFTNLGIGSGTVRVGSNIAAGIGGIAISNATLQSGGAAIALGNGVTTTGNALIDARTGEVLTLNGVVDGAGSISQIGAGTLVLNGANAFNNLGINSGTVRVGSNTAAGVGGVALNNNATLQSGGAAIALANTITTTANGIVNARAGEVLTLNGIVDGAGSISQTGPGTLVLNGNNSFRNLGINAGIVQVGSNTAAGAGGVALNNNAILQSGGAAVMLGNGVTTTGNGLVNVRTGEMLMLNGVVDGAGSISHIGAGTLVLNGANLFNNLGVNSGTVRVGSNTAAGIGGIALNGDATLQSGGANIMLGNVLTTTGNGLVNVRTGEMLTLNGVVDGVGSISQTGPGTLVLNANNSFRNLGINAGTVRVGSNTAAGVDGIALNSNAILQSGNANIVLGNLLTTTGNGLVNVRTGEMLTLNGVIDGAGSISQTGPGTLVLNGANLFNNLGINSGVVVLGSNTAAGIGGIALNGGATLRADALSGTTVTLANLLTTTGAGIIDVVPTKSLILNGIVDGAGSLTKTGTGSLFLSRANLYTGGTVLNAGTIAIGTSTSLGTGALTVNGGTLLANANGLTVANAATFAGAGTIDTGSNALAYSGVIGGAGRITKVGTGVLTLTGANVFTGGVTIAEGTVTGAAANLGAGGILNNAALIINQPTDASFTQVLSGTGTFTKSGAGALTLTAISTLSGPTTVSAGRYIVTGSVANSALAIQSGATLAGTGTVGALTVASGATVAPGVGGVGTLSVNGAVNLAAGSTFAVEIGGLTADRITASGPVTIAGNLTLATTGNITSFNSNYTLISSSARTGTFATVTGLSGFGGAFNSTIVYDGTSVFLRLAPTSLVAFGGGTLTGNPLEVASAFDRAVAAGYNPSQFFALYNQGANLSNALSQLSGELHSAERRVLLEDTRVVREAAFDRLNAGLSALSGQAVTSTDGEHSITAWLRVAGSWGVASADKIGSRFTTEQTGFLTGVDYASNGFKVGGLFHYTHNNVEFASLGTSKVESIGGAVYGGWRQENGFAVGVGGGIASNKAKGGRTITTPGLGQSLSSQVDGTTYQAFAEIAYDLVKDDNTRVEPFGRIGYAKVDSGAVSETGGFAAVVAADQSVNLTQTTLGLRGSYTTGQATLIGSAGWLHSSGDLSAATIIGISGLGQTSNIQTVALDKDAVAIEAQARYAVSEKITLGIGYSGVFGSNNKDHGARATLTVGF